LENSVRPIRNVYIGVQSVRLGEEERGRNRRKEGRRGKELKIETDRPNYRAGHRKGLEARIRELGGEKHGGRKEGGVGQERG